VCDFEEANNNESRWWSPGYFVCKRVIAVCMTLEHFAFIVGVNMQGFQQPFLIQVQLKFLSPVCSYNNYMIMRIVIRASSTIKQVISRELGIIH